MSVVRIVDPHRVRPTHVAMLCLLAATLTGVFLLTCGPQATLEGAKDWHEESLLRAVVTVLNLDYAYTTYQGIEIKSLVFGIGTAAALMIVTMAYCLRSKSADEPLPGDDIRLENSNEVVPVSLARRQVSPLAAAQFMMLAYLAWSFLSALWSDAPDLSVGGSVVLATGVAWAFALGIGLNKPTARIAAFVMIAACTLTAVLAIAYFGGRNPVRRAAYPIGNPLFLAACLIPGVILSISTAAGAVDQAVRRHRSIAWLAVAVCSIALALLLYACYLTSSRGAAVALIIGLTIFLVLALPRDKRLPVAIAALLMFLGAGVYLWPRLSAPSPTGRDASLRLRQYAWWYAVDLIDDAMFLGYGQGGYTRIADGFAKRDVMNDPQALEARVAHAHNEWLETWADLGMVGFLLAAGAVILTVFAAAQTATRAPPGMDRWTLLGLCAALVALAIEECSDNALRVAGFPVAFYSVLGLVWALARTATESPRNRSMGRWFRWILLPAGCIAAIALLTAWSRDFRAARATYDAEVALQKQDFDSAVALASLGPTDRLSPQRRLEAWESLCSTHVRIARAYQVSAIDRKQRASSGESENAALLQMAQDDRASSETHIAAGLAALDALVRRSPDYWGAGWLEFRLYQLRNTFAQWDADASAAAGTAAAAAAALDRELNRRPFDAGLALTYVAWAHDSIPLDERLIRLARPLRYAAIPPDYDQYLGPLSASPNFDALFAPIWQRLTATPETEDQRLPFTPELFRLAARIQFIRFDYAEALNIGQMALIAYDRELTSPTIGTASCFAEVGDYQFFADPGKWRQALLFSTKAIETMPDSTPGRTMAAYIKDRTITYYLAGQDEDSAKALLTESLPSPDRETISKALGSRYALLCKTMIRRNRDSFPPDFDRWVGRALELNPDDELAWRLDAQRAYDDKQFDGSVDRLRQALQRGADPSLVFAFVQLALREHPDSEPFLTLEKELRAVLGPAAATESSTSGPESTTATPESPPPAPDAAVAPDQPTTSPGADDPSRVD